MNEFVSTQRLRAAAVLLEMFHQHGTPGIDPIMELISRLLADEMGSIPGPAQSALKIDQWFAWHELAMKHPKILGQVLTRVIARERLELPLEGEAQRVWAATLVLTTLDWLALP